MWIDAIVEQIRKAREAHAVKFDYDLDAIVADLKKAQQQARRPVVSFPPKTPAGEIKNR